MPAPPPNFDVIVCGSLHLDILVRGADLPRLDETAVGESWAEVCGGKGGNQAVQAQRQGARTAFIGKVGKDGFGEKLLANLNQAGVDRSAVGIDPARGSGMSVAIMNADGDYGAVIVSGANLVIDPLTVADAWEKLGRARVLVLQNEGPEAVNFAAAKAARTTGGLVILNAAPARPFRSELLELVDILVVNRVEAAMLAGVPVDSAVSARVALSRLAVSGQQSIIITLGSDGLVAKPAGGEPVEIPPMPVQAVSTHGAGDCFVGVLAKSLSGGEDLMTACRIANAAASQFVAGVRQ